MSFWIATHDAGTGGRGGGGVNVSPRTVVSMLLGAGLLSGLAIYASGSLADWVLFTLFASLCCVSFALFRLLSPGPFSFRDREHRNREMYDFLDRSKEELPAWLQAEPTPDPDVRSHPEIGTLKLGISDFILWQAYSPKARSQAGFRTSAGLYATYQIEDRRSKRNFEIAFSILEGEQTIRKAMK
jgi:hypothetical protein